MDKGSKNPLAHSATSDDARSDSLESGEESDSDYSQSGETDSRSRTSSVASMEGAGKDSANAVAPLWARPTVAFFVVLASSLYLGASGNTKSICSWVTREFESTELVRKLMQAGASLEVAAHIYLPQPWNSFFFNVESLFPGAFILSCVATIFGLTAFGAIRLASRSSNHKLRPPSPRMYCSNRMTPAKFQDKGPTIRAVVQLLASDEFKEYARNKSQLEVSSAPTPAPVLVEDPKSQRSEV